MLETKIINTPEWYKKIMRKAKAREKYFMKRYGSLDRMYAKEAAFQARWDEESWQDEMRQQGLEPKKDQ